MGAAALARPGQTYSLTEEAKIESGTEPGTGRRKPAFRHALRPLTGEFIIWDDLFDLAGRSGYVPCGQECKAPTQAESYDDNHPKRLFHVAGPWITVSRDDGPAEPRFMLPIHLQHHNGSDMIKAYYSDFAPAYRPHSVSSTRRELRGAVLAENPYCVSSDIRNCAPC